MKLKSFYTHQNQLAPLEVEVTLWPGLPQLHFLGLADQHLKESAMRIKSAIKSSGFQWPKAQEILVNLQPSFIKKSSRGLELAVAYGVLRATGQIPESQKIESSFIYGELSLSGEVTNLEANCLLRTDDRLLEIHHLRDLLESDLVVKKPETPTWTRPQEFSQFQFSKAQSEIIKVLAFGEHSALLAGPSGAGKTTISDALSEMLREPSNREKSEIQHNQNYFGQALKWIPVVKPHHTIPIHSLVGGGNSPVAGEISRAHGGLLLMDELLEFSSPVLEALREPMQEKKISVARAGKIKEFPAKTIYIGTTNLCPCGDYIPNSVQKTSCNYSLIRCRSYSHRFTGPFLDRFEMLLFLDKKQEPQVPGHQILEELERAYETFESPQKIPISEIEALLPSHLRVPGVMPEFSSHRRRTATLKVAYSISALNSQSKIDELSFKKALKWTNTNFEKLKRWEV